MITLIPERETSDITSEYYDKRPRCLVNTVTYNQEYFDDGDKIPPYAILSHRWIAGQEVCSSEEYEEIRKTASEPDKELRQKYAWYQKILAAWTQLRITNKRGYQKILAACAHARKEGLTYIWVDTCCISMDQTKRSRDIQAMYGYYYNAVICYVYLADIDNPENPYTICHSQWFSRGWTLQELVAPVYVQFLNKNWENIATRESLAMLISMRTTIPQDVMRRTRSVKDVEMLERMSWAGGRETERPEDLAYCLMGLLGVSLETKYGEGVRLAFERLEQAYVNSNPGSKLHDFEGTSQSLYDVVLNTYDWNRIDAELSYGQD